MKIHMTGIAAAIITASALAASAAELEVEVSKQVEVAADQEAVWKVASEFCSIREWGGVFSDCTQEMVDGVVWRTLTIKDNGGDVREKLTDVSDTSYSYAITEAPLPLENHQGKIWVEQAGDGTIVHWDVAFDVEDGGDLPATTAEIEHILTTGLSNIKKIAETSAAQ